MSRARSGHTVHVWGLYLFFSSFFFFFFLFFFLKGALFKLALCLFCLGKTCSAAFNIKLLLRVYWEKRTCKMYPWMVLYWHLRRPQCISWPTCVEAPGCHLTICGGFRCIGKGLVNAYSIMVRHKSIFFSLPWLTKGRVNVVWIFLIMVSNWSVHRFSLPTVVFPWSRCIHNLMLF